MTRFAPPVGLVAESQPSHKDVEVAIMQHPQNALNQPEGPTTSQQYAHAFNQQHHSQWFPLQASAPAHHLQQQQHQPLAVIDWNGNALPPQGSLGGIGQQSRLQSVSDATSTVVQPGVIRAPIAFGPYSAPTAPARGASGGFLLWNDGSLNRGTQRFSTRAVSGSVVAPDVRQQLGGVPRKRKARRRRGVKDCTCIRHKPHHKERVPKSIFETFSPFDERFPFYMAHEPRFIEGFQAYSPFSEDFERITKWPSRRRSDGRRRLRNTKRMRLAKKYLKASGGSREKPKNWQIRSYHQHLTKRPTVQSSCGWESVSPFDAKFVVLTSKIGRYHPKTSTHKRAKGLVVCSPFDDRFGEQCQLGWWQEDDPDEFIAYSPFDSRFPSKFSPFKGRGRRRRVRSTGDPQKVHPQPPRANEPGSSPISAAPTGTAFPRMTPMASEVSTNLSFHIAPMYSIPAGFSPVLTPNISQPF
ncbi:hypothetical protein FOZ61_008220 [Perkinsus olseni]|uniref:Uncharacterized protein n=1 Tax=Perkinsus olseni TaxID=32597 RepID=A0A7J6M7H8_PEROL|nr:hypothetical protein FOL46_001378 [Perkinsus olseni]KAF4667507.1 hypothetical protein FOZ61_008220 [Perkinsus olseni]